MTRQKHDAVVCHNCKAIIVLDTEWEYDSMSANGNLHTVTGWLRPGGLWAGWELVAYDGGGFNFTAVFRRRRTT